MRILQGRGTLPPFVEGLHQFGARVPKQHAKRAPRDDAFARHEFNGKPGAVFGVGLPLVQ
jgi:hypothetical protein